MNPFEKFIGVKGEAKLRYLNGEFQVLSQGEFVRCAVTNEQIPLADLRYWSVEEQEPYLSAEVSLKRYDELRGKKA